MRIDDEMRAAARMLTDSSGVQRLFDEIELHYLRMARDATDNEAEEREAMMLARGLQAFRRRVAAVAAENRENDDE